MNKEHYYRLLENPRLLSKDSLKDLEDLITSYPYVENFRILYALNLLILDDYRYQKNLYKAAFHASDRKKLKYWVDFMLKDEESNIQIQEEEITKEPLESVEQETITKESLPQSTKTIAEKEEHQIIEKKPVQIEIPEDVIIEETPNPIVQTPLKEVEKEAQVKKKQEPIEVPIDLSEEKKEHRASKSKIELLLLVRKRLAEIEAAE